MTWMGAKTDIATITALDTTGLQDNIVFAAVAELKFLLLQKTSTATADNETVWTASPAGRWHLTGGGGVASSSIEVVANLAALQALTSASQDKLYALDTTPPQLFSWDAASTATVSDDIVKLTALANGRMYRFYPVASSGGGGSSNLMLAADIATILALSVSALPDGIQYYAIAEKLTLVLDKTKTGGANDVTCWESAGGTAFWYAHPNSVIISPDKPPEFGSALNGTTWVFAETNFDYDKSKSVITYVWSENTNTWEQVSARVRTGLSAPTTGSNPINGQEFWINRVTRFLYYTNIDTENGNTWEKVVM